MDTVEKVRLKFNLIHSHTNILNHAAYLQLVQQIRTILPDVSLSSDFICGFCGETDEEFAETLTLIDEVKYNVAFLFPYSMREVNEY